MFHTYSCYARGVNMINGAYHYIDLTPKSRDEADQQPEPQLGCAAAISTMIGSRSGEAP